MHTSHVSNCSWARPVGLMAKYIRENVKRLVLDHMSGHLGLGEVKLVTGAQARIG